MKRFAGIMPTSEVEKEKRFRVGFSKDIVIIQAGKNGWSILYADCSAEWKDVTDTTENNFENALKKLKTHFQEVVECNQNNKAVKMEVLTASAAST
jgi:hypothetical protein